MQAPLSFVLPTARSSGRSTALFDPRRPRGRDPPLCSPPSPAVCTASCSVRQARAHCDASLVASYLLVLIALPPISQRSARTSFQSTISSWSGSWFGEPLALVGQLTFRPSWDSLDAAAYAF
ncbi:unnamed protein product [Prorocentrum cordatum]|uniref:Uncharacterized protein n=1 Tax=Prorocentrum cordatum TaxID=2364126 RepID=A0ABN9SM17_9DINO|nr:unnamed protein product [Polarella glacialis]